MGREPRIIVPNFPHHIIHRGSRQQIIFFDENDKNLYLEILNYYCRREELKIWSYCLMDNHVHFIAVPLKPESISKVVQLAHKIYSQLTNRKYNLKGHLWEGRFHSYIMDELHLYAAVRYIERNPVRAGIVKKAEDYFWSSARAHVLGTEDKLITDFFLLQKIKNWSEYLSEIDKQEDLVAFKAHAKNGLPLGSDEFLTKLEKITGNKLRK